MYAPTGLTAPDAWGPMALSACAEEQSTMAESIIVMARSSFAAVISEADGTRRFPSGDAMPPAAEAYLTKRQSKLNAAGRVARTLSRPVDEARNF